MRKKVATFFYEDEFACPCCGEVKIDSDLIARLDYLRTELGAPIEIASGYRCPTYNKSLGGARYSAHTIGMAADISIPDNHYRFKLLERIFRHKLFNRIEVATGHIHVDVAKDPKYPQYILWPGISK
ncbi:DUF882 domain-containing protein [Candidatus Saccharibacteria bacterium]|nr:DUF882 domain-containing protein [Candidatus Saccharibacteria bacterium]